jgi:hypothetical protein
VVVSLMLHQVSSRIKEPSIADPKGISIEFLKNLEGVRQQYPNLHIALLPTPGEKNWICIFVDKHIDKQAWRYNLEPLGVINGHGATLSVSDVQPKYIENVDVLHAVKEKGVTFLYKKHLIDQLKMVAENKHEVKDMDHELIKDQFITPMGFRFLPEDQAVVVTAQEMNIIEESSAVTGIQQYIVPLLVAPKDSTAMHHGLSNAVTLSEVINTVKPYIHTFISIVCREKSDAEEYVPEISFSDPKGQSIPVLDRIKERAPIMSKIKGQKLLAEIFPKEKHSQKFMDLLASLVHIERNNNSFQSILDLFLSKGHPVIDAIKHNPDLDDHQKIDQLNHLMAILNMIHHAHEDVGRVEKWKGMSQLLILGLKPPMEQKKTDSPEFLTSHKKSMAEPETTPLNKHKVPKKKIRKFIREHTQKSAYSLPKSLNNIPPASHFSGILMGDLRQEPGTYKS